MTENKLFNDIDMEDLNELGDIPEGQVTYMVCAIGYAEDQTITDCELYFNEFSDPAKAIELAKHIDIEFLLQAVADQNQDMSEVSYFQVEVETLVVTEDNGSENIDTIWEKAIKF